MDRTGTGQFGGELFRPACMELFETMQCEVEIIGARHEFPVDIPLATIDAGSEELETIVLLKMPLAVLAMTYPASNVAEVEEEKLEESHLLKLSKREQGLHSQNLKQRKSKIWVPLPRLLQLRPTHKSKQLQQNPLML